MFRSKINPAITEPSLPVVRCRTVGILIATLLLGSLLPVPIHAATPGEKQGITLPNSCGPDFTDTLETPAGGHGFLVSGRDGHFYFEDGKRARFWGINVSSTRLNIPPDQIETVVTQFARAGLNLVRLEAIDNRNCLLGSVNAPDSLHFDSHYLDCLDHWMDALRRHGLYYYLDLLDFRTFKAKDKVLNAESLDRGARPYAVFDRYLIDLQKDYATQLLLHRNPYSGLRPVDDPALAMVEICNEHGLFLYPEKLETLVEPYKTNFRGQWNRWLLQKYGTRDKLSAAWGMVNGTQALRADEDLATNTVELPLLTHTDVTTNIVGVADVRRAMPRIRDGIDFLVSVQRSWFHEMRDHLREIGLRAPVTAVVSSDVIPDVASVAQECDFTAENWYADGGNEDPRNPSVRYFSNRNSLRDDSAGGIAPYTAALRWNNKPVVLREWAVPWPNRYRAASVPEALSYAALQNIDAVLLFGYQTNRSPSGADADALNDFAFQSDPTVWGLYALAGQAFLTGAIQEASQSVTLYYPYWKRFIWPNSTGDLLRLAWSVRVNNATEEAIDLVPHTNVLTPSGTSSDVNQLYRMLAQLGHGHDPLMAKKAEYGLWKSDTGQIFRFSREGRLQVQTSRLRMLAGEFKPGYVYSLGKLRFSTPNSFGALLIYALDGRPIESSQHIIAKMVSRAENTGEVFERINPGASDWLLRSPGTAPILTFGRASTQPSRLWIAQPEPPQQPHPNKKLQDKKMAVKKAPGPPDLLTLWMVDGTWELEIKDGNATFSCDASGLSGQLQGHSFTTNGGPMQVIAETSSEPAKLPSVQAQ